LQVAAFAEQLQYFVSEDEFHSSESLPMKLAAEAFIPSGLFNPSGKSDSPPQSRAIFTGRVLNFELRSNRLTTAPYHYFLVQSLGGVVSGRTRPAQGRKPGLARGREVHHRSDAHILDIRLPEGVTPFRLTRKAAKYATSGGGRPMRFIDRIEPAGTEEAVCIQVSAEDSLYVTEDFLLTHNTLNDAFIILDEAQNTTAEQMKMFLTRLGFGSKVVVTGDITQVDLPGGATSGLRSAMRILDGIDDIHFAELTSADVVRHRLVADIVDAYAKSEEPTLMNRAQRRASGARPRR